MTRLARSTRQFVTTVVTTCVMALSATAVADNFNVAQLRRSVVFIKRVTPRIAPSMASGFLVSTDGLVYTNRHVIDPAETVDTLPKIFVGVPSLHDVDELDYFLAQVIYKSPADDPLDFAILKIAARPNYGPFPALTLSFEKIPLGSDVAVIGYPYSNDNHPVLSFNKGSLSSTRVPIQGKRYYQTDAAVNPDNSGGPLLNEHGQAIGIVTLKNPFADNMGYALYLSDTQAIAEAAKRLADAVNPMPGPLDPSEVHSALEIPPSLDHWHINQTQTSQKHDSLVLHQDGGPYWITSQSSLPENFQLSVRCQLEFLKGEQPLYGTNSMRIICVRFGTGDTDQKILKTNGYHVQFSVESVILSKQGKFVKGVRKGNPDQAFILTITRQDDLITCALNDQIILTHQDENPLPGRHPFSLGGYLSRLHLGRVSVMDLDHR